MIQRPRLTKETARAAKAEAARYDLKDAYNGVAGLRMTVFPSGLKTWSLRYDIAGRDRRFTIGPYSESGITLDKARTLAKNRLLEVKDGRDPAGEKAEARRKAAAGIDPDALFSTAWGEWEKAPKPKSRNKKGWRGSTADRVAKLYANELEPSGPGKAGWGKRRLSEIRKADVHAYLDKIASDHPQGAARRYRVLASFFNWCVSKGRIETSPCDGYEAAKRNERERILSDDELRWLWKACGREPFPMGYFVRMLILTIARRNEVAQMTDSELQRGNVRKWGLPPSRTKNHRQHDIFLTDLMLDTLKAVPRVKNDKEADGYVFTTNGKTPFSGFSKAKKRLDAVMLEIAREEEAEIKIEPWTLHDLRRTGSTGMQKLGIINAVTDACLNHFKSDVYLKHNYTDEKIDAFQRWSAHIAKLVA